MSQTPIIRSTSEPFDAASQHELQVGQWYWVKSVNEWSNETDDNGKKLKKGEKYKWLGCIMQVGSNFVELKSPPLDHGYSSVRVHFDEFEDVLTPALEADQYIADRQIFYKQKVNALLNDVRELTARLGIVPTQQVSDHTGEGQNALVVVSAQVDTKAYKKALILAQTKTLPELFEKIKKANMELTRWMIAPSMALTASLGPMEESIGAIKDRVYTIELYAGLTEDAVKCCEGKPADIGEKLHVMQRRMYMDEECLMNYSAGGMEFNDITKFDKWLSKKENRNRILPFPRALVAFKVRRHIKKRENDGNLFRMFVNFRLEDADKRTFLYVRNGEQVWRVDCDFDFDEMIIPNKEEFNPSEPMMVRMSGNSVEEFVPKKRWDSIMAVERERKRKADEWEKANPKEHHFDNPFRNSENHHYEYESHWKPFDPSNVYYDEALKEIGDQIKKYNRIAVIVQGLFDRSEVLHPHIPVKMWEAESFNRSVELVYDAMTLTYGEKPDFEAYRARLNESISSNSIVTGQEDFWLRMEAVKENTRIENDWRHKGSYPNYVRFRPDDSPGPGMIGIPTEWKSRARKAVFRWTRESRNWRKPKWDRPDSINCSITVPANELLNVSAYTPGDYKQFFADPRTRQEYLKWAPLLLRAEDYHAGKKSKKSDDTVYGWHE